MAEAVAEKVTAPAPRTSAEQPPLSLTKAAKAVGVSTSTLRRAIEDEKLTVSRTAEGHYRIPIDQLMQYKSNEIDTPVDTGAVGVSTPQEKGVSQGGVADPVDTGVDTGVDTVSVERVYEAEKEVLRVQIKHQRDTIMRLERDVESWQEQANKWQAQTESYKFMLTDERDASAKLKDEIQSLEESRLSNEEAEEFQASTPGSKWPVVAAVVVTLAVVGAGLSVLYPDQVQGLVSGQGGEVAADTLTPPPREQPLAAGREEFDLTAN